jgi:hypothetical protein
VRLAGPPNPGKVRQIGFPVTLSDTSTQMKNLAHIEGFGTERIMEELIYSREEVRSLM